MTFREKAGYIAVATGFECIEQMQRHVQASRSSERNLVLFLVLFRRGMLVSYLF